MADDCYPTDKELDYVKNYDCSKLPVKVLLDYIESIWWMPSWGFEMTERTDDYACTDIKGKEHTHQYHVLNLSTGGWSGNEDIMVALKSNKWFHCFYWVQSRRGGHYIFEFDKERYKEIKKDEES